MEVDASTLGNGGNAAWWKRAIPYLVIVAMCASIYVVPLTVRHPARVGDASEYYALALAWKVTGRPYMTDASWKAYADFEANGGVLSLGTEAQISRMYQALVKGPTQDFHHFWFFSMLAAAVGAGAAALGWQLSVHAWFLVLNGFLLFTAVSVAWHAFGWRGLVACSFVLFLSPSLWYLDKVHTEWLTVCMATCAVVLFLRDEYAPAALCLAIASTQNVSFAGPAAVLVLLRVAAWRARNWRPLELALLPLAVGVMLLNPAYTYYRWAVWSPLIMTGSARVGANLEWLGLYLYDPDVGLLPNWPAGLLVLLGGGLLLAAAWRPAKRRVAEVVFFGVYIAACAWAQASALVINSGGTPGLSRYALWYIPLWFPLCLLLLKNTPSSKLAAGILVIAVSLGIVTAVIRFLPSRPETYVVPTAVSNWIQRWVPRIYDPPPEIFAQRYGRTGSREWLQALAVLGPDCRKALIVSPLQESAPRILGGRGCMLDFDKLSGLMMKIPEVAAWRPGQSPGYIRLPESVLDQARFQPTPGEWYPFSMGGQGTAFLDAHWAAPESWGVWSLGRRAALTLPCVGRAQTESGGPRWYVEMEMFPFTGPSHESVDVVVQADDGTPQTIHLSELRAVTLGLPNGTCSDAEAYQVALGIINPASPYSLGMWADQRELGVGLTRVRFTMSSE